MKLIWLIRETISLTWRSCLASSALARLLKVTKPTGWKQKMKREKWRERVINNLIFVLRFPKILRPETFKLSQKLLLRNLPRKFYRFCSWLSVASLRNPKKSKKSSKFSRWIWVRNCRVRRERASPSAEEAGSIASKRKVRTHKKCPAQTFSLKFFFVENEFDLLIACGSWRSKARTLSIELQIVKHHNPSHSPYTLWKVDKALWVSRPSAGHWQIKFAPEEREIVRKVRIMKVIEWFWFTKVIKITKSKIWIYVDHRFYRQFCKETTRSTQVNWPSHDFH